MGSTNKNGQIVTTEIAIVGAGPFGLSLAAQLRARGVPFRIFGPPMESWAKHMPAGMHLKSDGFASDLYDARREFTLKQYCAERGIEYDDLLIPVRIETFIAYGREFQARLVPNLEKKLVTNVRRAGDHFEVELEDGEVVRANRVVIGTGVAYLGRLPPELAKLPESLCAHSSGHHDLSRFAGKSVVVVGGGSSATDVAALLHAAGASPTIVSRNPVRFSEAPKPGKRSLWQRMRKPHLGLGSSFRSALYTLFPNLFHLLPRSVRMRIVKRHLGPIGGWFMKPLVDGVVPIRAGYSLREAQDLGGKVSLRFLDSGGKPLELTADYVIAATGYEMAVDRLPILDRALLDVIDVEDRSPVLSRHFESSVPGLYFMGLLAANSFGPLLRFALGAEFCAVTVANHLARVAKGRVPTMDVAPEGATG